MKANKFYYGVMVFINGALWGLDRACFGIPLSAAAIITLASIALFMSAVMFWSCYFVKEN